MDYELWEYEKFLLFRILFLNSILLEFGFKLWNFCFLCVIGSLMNIDIFSLTLSFSGWLLLNDYCFGCYIVNDFMFV